MREGSKRTLESRLKQGASRRGNVSNHHSLPPDVRGLRAAWRASVVSAKKRGLDWTLSFEEFAAFVKTPCHYCGDLGKAYRTTQNGVDRVKSEIGYFASNCVSCCKLCNMMKNVLPAKDFISHVGKIARFWRSILITLDDNDKQILKIVAWKEARADGLAACNLVMHVCLNRVGKEGFGHTLHDVIFGRNQFTSMSVPSDPEFNLDPEKSTGVDREIWDQLQYVVDNIEGDDDATHGALFYQNPKTANSGWFERNIGGPDGKGLPGHPLLLTFEHHSFYA